MTRSRHVQANLWLILGHSWDISKGLPSRSWLHRKMRHLTNDKLQYWRLSLLTSLFVKTITFFVHLLSYLIDLKTLAQRWRRPSGSNGRKYKFIKELTCLRLLLSLPSFPSLSYSFPSSYYVRSIENSVYKVRKRRYKAFRA